MRRDYMTGPTAFAILADTIFNLLRAVLGVACLALFAFGVTAFALFALTQWSDHPLFIAVPNP